MRWCWWAARGVLHKPEESDGAGDGFADDRAGIDACERVGAGGDGGDEEEELTVDSLQFTVDNKSRERYAQERRD